MLEIAEKTATIPVNNKPKAVITGYIMAKNKVHILLFTVVSVFFMVLLNR